MQRRSWHVLWVIILTVILLISTPHAHAEMEAKPHLAGSPYDLINAVNALRASYGLAPYGINPILMITAQSQADYMAATGIVSHTGSEGSSVTDRLLAAGYPLAGDLSFGGFRSENITAGSDGMSAQIAVDQWTGDSLHLNTMISTSLTEIGAGASVNAGRVYYVIDCAQPTNGVPPNPGTSVAGPTADPAGGAVIIPVVVSTPNADGELVHEVKAGQTLWQIAISYGVRIDEIKRLNNLSNDDIYSGTKLLVKKGVIISPTVAIEKETASTMVTATVVPAGTAILAISATNIIPVQSSPISTASSRPITGYVIGIVVLALVGGGLFVWLGDVKKE